VFPFRPKPPPASGLGRAQSLALVPVVSRDVSAAETAEGLVRLSLPLAVRPALAGWARRLGLWDGRVLRKTVELDVMGSAVWRLIDGRRSAGAIATALAGRYRLDPREAELAVAQFLRQLGRRGAIGVVEGRGESAKENVSGDRGR
jgi:hypothetical protein